MRVLYDPKCEELARYFLESYDSEASEKEIADLAGEIQVAIEDWMKEHGVEA